MADNKITAELNEVMKSAVIQLQKLVNNDLSRQNDFLPIVSLFLTGVVSTTADLIELQLPGGALTLYSDVEAMAKVGGLRAVRSMQALDGKAQYSVSGIAPDDMEAAMNYMGQELSATLFKTIHELPIPLKKPEMLLRGVEALLANLLNQRFNNSHEVMDSLCEHVHMALRDLESRRAKSDH